MFKQKIKINFYDCDPAGILFYANLFKFAHKTYEALISSFNQGKEFFNNGTYVVPIVHAEGDYLSPMKPGDEIEAIVKVSQLRNSSFELTYNFVNKDLSTSATVKTVHVFVDKKTFKKISMPKDFSIFLKANKV